MQCGSSEFDGYFQREGDGASPLYRSNSSHFQAVRDDRDGHSRYRVSKMSIFFDELGWYRDNLAPKLGARFIILKFLMEVIQYE